MLKSIVATIIKLMLQSNGRIPIFIYEYANETCTVTGKATHIKGWNKVFESGAWILSKRSRCNEDLRADLSTISIQDRIDKTAVDRAHLQNGQSKTSKARCRHLAESLQ